MRDNAVSVVIGYMILLVITVSFIALLNAIWIPQMKQQAEVEHLGQVENSFLALATDIDRLTTYRQNASITHRIQLGGGDVLFSPVRSSGSLQIRTIHSNDDYLEISDNRLNITGLNLMFVPVNNFWVNQGYIWENGTIFVSKPGKKTPLEIWDNSASFLTNNLCPKVEQVSGNLTNVTISIVTQDENQEAQIGGSGIGTVYCHTNCTIEQSDNVDTINFSGIATGWKQNLLPELKLSGVKYTDSINSIDFDPPVNITVKKCLLHLQLG